MDVKLLKKIIHVFSELQINNTPGGMLNSGMISLETRFRDSPGNQLLENIRFEIKNVKTRKNPADYVSAIVFNAKNAEIATDKTFQVLLINEHMDGHLKRDLPRPSISLTVIGLFKKLHYQTKKNKNKNKQIQKPNQYFNQFRPVPNNNNPFYNTRLSYGYDNG